MRGTLLVTFLFSTLVLHAQTANDELTNAIAAYQAGKADTSKALLVTLVETNQANEIVYYYLGLIEHDRSSFPIAEEYYRKSIEANPNYAPAHAELSFLLLQNQKYVEAEQLARRAVTLDPSYIDATIHLAGILMAEGKRDEAYRYYLQTAQIDPDAICDQGDQMLIKNKNPTAAMYYYNIVFQVEPNHPFALLHMGHCYGMLGRPDQALGWYKRGYENTPIHQPPFDLLYNSYFRGLLDSNQMEVILQNAAQKAGPDYPNANLFLALSYYKLSNAPLFNQYAEKYFLLLQQEEPESLDQWAKEMCRLKKADFELK